MVRVTVRNECRSASFSQHDLCGYWLGAAPDRYVNEEWFGLTSPALCDGSVNALSPREAYWQMRKLWTEESDEHPLFHTCEADPVSLLTFQPRVSIHQDGSVGRMLQVGSVAVLAIVALGVTLRPAGQKLYRALETRSFSVYKEPLISA